MVVAAVVVLAVVVVRRGPSNQQGRAQVRPARSQVIQTNKASIQTNEDSSRTNKAFKLVRPARSSSQTDKGSKSGHSREGGFEPDQQAFKSDRQGKDSPGARVRPTTDSSQTSESSIQTKVRSSHTNTGFESVRPTRGSSQTDTLSSQTDKVSSQTDRGSSQTSEGSSQTNKGSSQTNKWF